MGKSQSLEGIAVFVAVAKALSFTAAAKQLSISPSATSQAVRNLEERLGTLLLRRTTRSIRLTDAGADYLAAIEPALVQLHRATQDIEGRSVHPSGHLRLILPRAAFTTRIAPLLKQFQEMYPGIVLELDVEARLVDIVAQGFDAGIRYGSLLERDMVAVKIAGGSTAIVVAAPAYLARRTEPIEPKDLTTHVAVVTRREMTGPLNTWKLQHGQKTIQLLPPAAMIVQDLLSEIELIVRGIGIGCVPKRMVAAELKKGTLVHVLKNWSSDLGDLFLFFPSQRHKSVALRAFIEHVRRHPLAIG